CSRVAFRNSLYW
nr:immunoglobulin heavy chain junction region [Macaca mulatta]